MPGAISLVIIDGNSAILQMLSSALATEGVEIVTASEPEAGLDLVFKLRPQIVLADLPTPGLHGLHVLERIVAFDPSIHVILMTACATAESAVAAIRKGAADYMSKPIPVAVLREKVAALVREKSRRGAAGSVISLAMDNAPFQGMVGCSPLLVDMCLKVRKIAPHFRTALITGDTGTGKELVARALHRQSPAARGRFVVLNCSAVVETLFESELFGHVRGAFTGAVQDKTGLFEHADQGTIFLDEIGDMPLATQAKLLRTLQYQEVLRVGSLTARKINVRVIAATHKDLRQAIADRQFREDLYYRLAMVEVAVPRLADRQQDLPALARHFIAHFAAQFGKTIRSMTHRAHIMLARHHWPGNVRELENVIGHGCMMVNGDMIDVQDLPGYLRAPGKQPALQQPALQQPAARFAQPGTVSDEGLEAQERRLISEALAESAWNQSVTARKLGIGRDALRYKMKKHGIGGTLVQMAAAS